MVAMASTSMPRPIPPPLAAEREMLESWLEFHRTTLAQKCAGLDDEQVRTASVPPSPLTLLGLVQHVAEVERKWFQRVFAGRDVPPIYEAEYNDRDGGFTLVPGRGMDEALAVWRTEIETGRRLTAGVSLDDEGRLPEPESTVLGERVSLRWILHHMVEEYARHNGQADLLRERIDGVTGT